MRRDEWDDQIRWGVTAFAVLALTASVVFFIFNFKIISDFWSRIYSILAPIIYGAVLAYLLTPLYNMVFDWVKPRARKLFPTGKTARDLARLTATLSAFCFIALIGVGLVYMIIPELYKSITSLANTVPQNAFRIYQDSMTKLGNNPELRAFMEDAYLRISDFFNTFVADKLLPNVQNIFTVVSRQILSIVYWVKNIILGLIVMLYLLNMKETLIRQVRRFCYAAMPDHRAKAFLTECRRVDQVFGQFIVGKTLDSLIIGVICFFAMSLLKMPYSMLVSVIVGVTNVIPFFGPFIGAIPSFLLILLVNPLQSLYFLIFILVLQQFDGNFLGPKILGGSTGMSSFWVLFSILLFGGLFGFVGMIIGVPAWAVIMSYTRRFVNARNEQKRRERMGVEPLWQTEQEKERMS